jgi:hypothetical protein
MGYASRTLGYSSGTDKGPGIALESLQRSIPVNRGSLLWVKLAYTDRDFSAIYSERILLTERF